MVSDALRWRLLSDLTLPRSVSMLTVQQGRLYALFITVVARSLAVPLAVAALRITLALLKRSLQHLSLFIMLPAPHGSSPLA